MENVLKPGIVAAVVTHRRPAELQRLLDGLGASSLPLLGCVVSDHAPTGATREIAAGSRLPTVVLEDAANPGPGSGWANAARRALDLHPAAIDAIWFLDDDVTIPVESLATLWREMRRAEADAIAPLLEDARGQLWAFPEPEPRPLRKTIRQATTPAAARKLLGEDPIPFCWCTGASFLVKASTIRKVGFHRTDFFMLGEDLEYSMRIAAAHRAVFTCQVSIPHLPPPAGPQTSNRDYIKFCSLLQNLSYLSLHTPNRNHMKSYLPGNFRRFFRTHGIQLRTVRDAATCWWNGAVMARPSGTPAGEALRVQIGRYGNRN